MQTLWEQKKAFYYVRKDFNSHRICLEHQEGSLSFIVWPTDLMWKCSVATVFKELSKLFANGVTYCQQE